MGTAGGADARFLPVGGRAAAAAAAADGGGGFLALAAWGFFCFPAAAAAADVGDGLRALDLAGFALGLVAAASAVAAASSSNGGGAVVVAAEAVGDGAADVRRLAVRAVGAELGGAYGMRGGRVASCGDKRGRRGKGRRDGGLRVWVGCCVC